MEHGFNQQSVLSDVPLFFMNQRRSERLSGFIFLPTLCSWLLNLDDNYYYCYYKCPAYHSLLCLPNHFVQFLSDTLGGSVVFYMVEIEIVWSEIILCYCPKAFSAYGTSFTLVTSVTKLSSCPLCWLAKYTGVLHYILHEIIDKL